MCVYRFWLTQLLMSNQTQTCHRCSQCRPEHVKVLRFMYQTATEHNLHTLHNPTSLRYKRQDNNIKEKQSLIQQLNTLNTFKHTKTSHLHTSNEA